MPREDEKKIKLAPKTRRGFRENVSILTAFFIIFLALVFALYFVASQSKDLNKSESPSCIGVQLAQGCYELEKATTNEQRMNGLSYRDSLGEKTGMLFIFETIEEQCFWMKDMKFSIDMIWLNEAKEITKIEKNVSPGSYPKSFCQGDTKYVLEFNAGVSDQNGLKVGSRLQF
ncbi:DUF192 domain-containing protein [Candidatus Saccharibacteria bacterium]|nr:DUF192 domain-containing protein [Candidatus Saccharibacteria bacterium]